MWLAGCGVVKYWCNSWTLSCIASTLDKCVAHDQAVSSCNYFLHRNCVYTLSSMNRRWHKQCFVVFFFTVIQRWAVIMVSKAIVVRELPVEMCLFITWRWKAADYCVFLQHTSCSLIIHWHQKHKQLVLANHSSCVLQLVSLTCSYKLRRFWSYTITP